MTTDEHDPTSQPWPPSQLVDIAGRGGDPDAGPPDDPARNETEPLTGPDGPAEQASSEAPATGTGPGDSDSAVGTDAPDKSTEPGVPGDPEAARATGSEDPAPGHGDAANDYPTASPAEPGTPPWPDGNGFEPPPQTPADGGARYGNGPFDQFAPPAPGGAFSAPAPEQFPAPGSAQFTQPDPNEFQPTNIGPGADAAQAWPGQFQAPDTGYGSGQFPQPDASQFHTPNTENGSGQFPQPAPGQFLPGGPGQNPPDPFAVPGPPTGQYPQQDPNLFPGQPDPGQPPYAPPAPQPIGGYAPPAAPQPGSAPASDNESGGAIYSWAPPPVPAAPPPVPQPQYQSAPPPAAHNPPTGQFQPPAWGDPGQPPAPQQPPQQQFQQHAQPGQHSQPGQQQFPPRQVPEPGQLGSSVNDLNLLKRARKAPRSGWRRAVHKVSRGAINPGESASDVVHRDLVSRVNAPVYGDFRIAILSLKGGVGKTTTTVGLGATFASLRGDRVIAIDANPDLGTLAHRVPRQTRSTVRNLLEDRNITRYSDVRAHTSQSPSRLEVLASEQDPAVSEAFSEADYRRAIEILQSFYNIILTDCGTGLMHSAMSGVLDMASSLVLVTSPAIDGARSASATLDWLDYHGYSHLVQQTVVVVNASRRGSTSVNLDHLRRLFLDRTRAVQVVPFDDHLAEGAEIDLELVSKPTRQALLELAAMVADDFANVDGYPYGNRY